MSAPFAPDAPSAVPQRVRLTPATLTQAESFIAKHEPDAFPPVRAAAGPLHAVGDRVTVTLVGEVTAISLHGATLFYDIIVPGQGDSHAFLIVPAFRLSAMEG